MEEPVLESLPSNTTPQARQPTEPSCKVKWSVLEGKHRLGGFYRYAPAGRYAITIDLH